jgi:protocatechuate 3,4-dioxygenase beta subunit
MDQSPKPNGASSGRRTSKPVILAASVFALAAAVLGYQSQDASSASKQFSLAANQDLACATGTDCPDDSAAQDPSGLHSFLADHDSNAAHDPQESLDRGSGANFAADPASQLYPGITLPELCAADGCQAISSSELPAALLQIQNPDRDAEPGSISGQVLTPEGIGLERVAIVATGTKSANPAQANAKELRFRTVTDALGEYRLDNLPAGEYKVRSSARGEFRAARISVRTGSEYADLLAARHAQTQISGQVLGESGEPLEGVTVLPVVLGQPSILTDANGRFELTLALKPGVRKFDLRFQRPGYVELNREVAAADAASIESAALDVVLKSVESWTSLAGSVSDTTGQPLAGLNIELRLKNARQSTRATTDTEGQFRFPMVEAPAAAYLTVSGSSRHADTRESIRLTTDMQQLDIVLEPFEFGTVTGQLVNQEGAPIPDFELVFRHSKSTQPNAVVRSDRLGNFLIPAAPAGKFVLASQSDPALLVQGATLKPGAELRLPVVLDWGQHALQGRIVDAQGQPVAASRISLSWSADQNGIKARATRRTSADSQGLFTFNNLGPGPHSLQVTAAGFHPVEVEHDIRRQGYQLTVRLNPMIPRLATNKQ